MAKNCEMTNNIIRFIIVDFYSFRLQIYVRLDNYTNFIGEICFFLLYLTFFAIIVLILALVSHRCAKHMPTEYDTITVIWMVPRVRNNGFIC